MKNDGGASHLLENARLCVLEKGRGILIEARLATDATEVVSFALIRTLPHGILYRGDLISGDRTDERRRVVCRQPTQHQEQITSNATFNSGMKYTLLLPQ